MADIYPQKSEFENSNGNINFSFDGGLNLSEKQISEFIDELDNSFSDTGVVGGTSGVPERKARVLIQRNSTYASLSGNFVITSSDQDSTSDPFTLYITNDTTSVETVEFFNDTIKYPSAISGETTFQIDPGKTAVLFRLSNFEWHVLGDFSNSNLSGGSGSDATVVGVDESRKINTSITGIDWAKSWSEGIVAYDGSTIEAIDWDGTQVTSVSPGSTFDNNLGFKSSPSVYENFLYSSEDFYISELNLRDGTEKDLFMETPDVFENEPDNFSSIISNNVLYISGVTVPSSLNDLYVASKEIPNFSDGDTDSWDQARKIELEETPNFDTNSTTTYYYDGVLIIFVNFGVDTATALFSIDPVTLDVIKQKRFTAPNGVELSLDTIFKFGDYFYTFGEDINSSDQWLLEFDRSLDVLNYANRETGSIDSYRGTSAFLGQLGEIYFPLGTFIDNEFDARLFEYSDGRLRLIDETEFRFPTNDVSPIPSETVYTPRGVWLQADYGGSGTEWAPLSGSEGIIEPRTGEINYSN